MTGHPTCGRISRTGPTTCLRSTGPGSACAFASLLTVSAPSAACAMTRCVTGPRRSVYVTISYGATDCACGSTKMRSPRCIAGAMDSDITT